MLEGERPTVTVRDARLADLRAITAIYNALIPTLTATWTEELDTLEHRTTWFERQRVEGFPVLVAEMADEVIGFATYEHFRGEGKWPGYRATAELSIHVREIALEPRCRTRADRDAGRAGRLGRRPRARRRH